MRGRTRGGDTDLKLKSLSLALLVLTGGLAGLSISGDTGGQASIDCLAHWSFDEGSGTAAADSTGNLHEGLVSGAVWTTGICNGALDFDGSDDYVAVQISTALNNLAAFTYEAWIYPRADSHWHVISKGTGSKRLYSENSGTSLDLTGRVRYSGDDALSRSTDNTITLNAWQHVAMTWSTGSDSVRLFRNGAEVGYAYTILGDNTVENDAQNPYMIGARSDLVAGTFFSGIIDEVSIWGRVLTQEEIMANYESMVLPGRPGGLAATPGNAQVTLAWTAAGTNISSPVTGYRILRGLYPGTETAYATVGNVLTYTDTGLVNGQTYYYRVAGINAYGTGPATPSIAAAPRTVPGAVQQLHAGGGDGYIWLSWSPADDGGSAVTQHRIYRSTDSGGETELASIGNVLNYNDTAVDNGRTYFYIVVAVNAAGDGALSAEASAVPGQGAGTGMGGSGSANAALLAVLAIIIAVLLAMVLILFRRLRRKPAEVEFVPLTDK